MQSWVSERLGLGSVSFSVLGGIMDNNAYSCLCVITVKSNILKTFCSPVLWQCVNPWIIPAGVLVGPFLVQLPTNEFRKVMEDDPVTWVLVTHMGSKDGFLVAGCSLARFGCSVSLAELPSRWVCPSAPSSYSLSVFPLCDPLALKWANNYFLI